MNTGEIIDKDWKIQIFHRTDYFVFTSIFNDFQYLFVCYSTNTCV